MKFLKVPLLILALFIAAAVAPADAAELTPSEPKPASDELTPQEQSELAGQNLAIQIADRLDRSRALDEEIQNLFAQMDLLQNEVTLAQERLQARGEVLALNLKTEDLQQIRARATTALAELRININLLQGDIAALETRRAELQSSALPFLTEKLGDASEKFGDLDRRIDACEKAGAPAADRAQSCDDIREEREALRLRLKDIQNVLSENQNELNNVISQLHERTMTLGDQQHAMYEAQSEGDQAERDLKTLDASLANARMRLAAAEAAYAKLAAASAELQALWSAIEGKRGEMQALNEEAQRLSKTARTGGESTPAEPTKSESFF